MFSIYYATVQVKWKNFLVPFKDNIAYVYPVNILKVISRELGDCFVFLFL